MHVLSFGEGRMFFLVLLKRCRGTRP
jgi:hypothetical protein